jgi:gliotoxin/aspirochlorine biosynthesis aminotransferase
LFVFAKVAPGATTWDEEATAVERLREGGVKVSPGRSYNGSEEEKGWARITFAVPEDVLNEGMARLKSCFA